MDFRGGFAELFTTNARTAAEDATALAGRLREVKTFMRLLVTAAEEENARRERARKYVATMQARRENWWDSSWDSLFGIGEVPREEPSAPPQFEASVAPQTERGRARQAGEAAVSSARPSALRTYAIRVGELNVSMNGQPRALERAAATFMEHCDFGGIDVSPVILGFAAWLSANAQDVDWINTVAAAFEAAGAGAGIAAVPDAALSAALAAAGVNAAREDLTIDPPQAYGGVPTTGYSNDPVNTSTGNFLEPENDLAFIGAASSLSLTRMYNSLDRESGVFGRGWSSILDVRLEVGDEAAVYVQADGRHVRFARAGEGWDRAGGENLWLSREPSDDTDAGFGPAGHDVLAVRDNQGSVWAFSSAGSWLGYSAGPGSKLVVVRDGCGQIIRLEHEWGRSITIDYQDGRVVSARASDGRLVEYLWDEAGRLNDVVTRAGARRYRWNAAGLIDQVLSAAGVMEAENLYDDRGRVVEQTTAFGRRVRFAYLPGRVTAVSDADGTRSNTWISDARGRVVGVIDSAGMRQSMSYDGAGNLVQVIERDGAVTVHAYDERGRRTRTVTPEGADTAFGYDSDDRVTTVVAATGGVVEYVYDGKSRNPSRVTDPGGGVTELRWQGGLLTEITDPMGVVVVLGRDEHGDVISVSSADGSVARFQRGADGLPVKAISPSGRRTRLRYDALGRIETREDPDGAIWRFEYDRSGRLIATIDPLGARVGVEYGAHGEVQTTTDPLGRRLTREFDELGNVTALQRPDGGSWTFAHDALSRLREVTDPLGGLWQRAHDSIGRVAATIDPTGVRVDVVTSRADCLQTVQHAFSESSVRSDQFGRPIHRQAEDGSAEILVYDACGRPIEVLDADGGLTRVVRDAAGRPTSVTSPMGRTVRYEYDACGRVVASIDGEGARWTLEYDKESRVAARISPSGEVSRTRYDAVGRVIRADRSGGGVTRFGYDKAGRTTFVQDAWHGIRRFRYDLAGQLIEAVNGVGGVTRYAYDSCGRLTSVTDPLGSVSTYAYDAADRLVSVTDPLGRETQTAYDAAGRPLVVTEPDGRVTALDYGPDGILASLQVDGRRLATISHDAKHRSTTVMDLTHDTTVPTVHRMVHDRAGRLTERSRNGVSVRWEYDRDGARTAQIDPAGLRTEYEQDACGRPTRVSHPTFGLADFRYDLAGRMVASKSGGTTQRWEHPTASVAVYTRTDAHGTAVTRTTRDAAGRIERIDGPDGATCYTYDDAGQLIEARGASEALTWQFDAAGRLVRESGASGERAFTYDEAGQLLSIVGPDGKHTFTYDGSGRRVRAEGATDTSSFGWSDLGLLESVAIRDAAGATRSVHLDIDVLGEVAGADGMAVWWDTAAAVPSPISIGGTPVLRAPGGAVGIGDAWTASGWRAQRSTDAGDPWAILTAVQFGTDPGGPGSPPLVGLTPSGALAIAGLEWMGARAYDPGTRGFLSTDPLPPVVGAAWSGNPYSFAGNDPLQQLDPLGLRPLTDADLEAYAHANQGAFASAGESFGAWWGDNWELALAGLAIGAGVGLMLTGVGAPGGLALFAASGALLSGGLSVASQKLQTGEVDWSKVGVDTIIGGATGVFGAAGAGIGTALRVSAPVASAARTVAINVSANGGLGALTGAGTHLAANDWKIRDGREFAGAAVGGGLSGAVAGLAGPAGGTIANAAGRTASGTLASVSTAVITGAGSSAGAVVSSSVAGQPIDPKSVLLQGLGGAAGSAFLTQTAGAGFGSSGASTFRELLDEHPGTLSAAFNLRQPAAQELWGTAAIGNVVGGLFAIAADRMDGTVTQ